MTPADINKASELLKQFTDIDRAYTQVTDVGGHLLIGNYTPHGYTQGVQLTKEQTLDLLLLRRRVKEQLHLLGVSQ
jgi:hypothetical protein